jgi:hypothetical protein
MDSTLAIKYSKLLEELMIELENKWNLIEETVTNYDVDESTHAEDLNNMWDKIGPKDYNGEWFKFIHHKVAMLPDDNKLKKFVCEKMKICLQPDSILHTAKEMANPEDQNRTRIWDFVVRYYSSLTSILDSKIAQDIFNHFWTRLSVDNKDGKWNSFLTYQLQLLDDNKLKRAICIAQSSHKIDSHNLRIKNDIDSSTTDIVKSDVLSIPESYSKLVINISKLKNTINQFIMFTCWTLIKLHNNNAISSKDLITILCYNPEIKIFMKQYHLSDIGDIKSVIKKSLYILEYQGFLRKNKNDEYTLE